VGAKPLDFALQPVRNALAVFRLAFARLLEAVGEARRDERDLHQQGIVWRTAPGVAADGERAQRVAMIALPAGDEAAALRLADLQEVLPRQLERGLDCLRAAADEIHSLDAVGRALDQRISEPLGRFRGEEAGVDISKIGNLLLYRAHHVGMAVPEARNRGAAG